MHRIHRFGLAAAMAVAAPLLSLPPARAAESAHSHGVAQLDVAVEAQKISIRFESPLDNLVGFERAPRTDAERRLVDAALAKLNAADALFRIDPAAQCKPAKVELASAALKLGPPGAAEDKSGHADIDGSFEFACADAAKAVHIDLRLFEFKRLQRLEVQLVTPKGQFKRTLKAPAGRLLLGK